MLTLSSNPSLATQPSLLDVEDPPFLGKVAEQHAPKPDGQQSQNSQQTDKLMYPLNTTFTWMHVLILSVL